MGKHDKHSLANMREPLFWPIMPSVRNAALRGMANRAKSELHQVESGVDIVTAHGEAVANYPKYKQLIGGASLFLRLIGQHPLRGLAADLGSGTGVAACILSKFEGIDQIFAVEYSEPFVTDIMPVVFERFKARVHKIQRVVGDFNNLQFEDNSLDIVVELAAFHHSEALDLTVKECWRVLRPGGVLLAIDRAWPDSYSQEQLDGMLDRQFSNDMKRKYGISESANFTRHDWGEHEYRFSQWFATFEQAGFDTVALMQNYPRVRGLNRVLRRLPTFGVSVVFASFAYRSGRRRLWIYGLAPHRVLFICIK